MDGDDVFVWPDGSKVFRHEYDDLTDRWRGDDFEILYVGTIEYNDFFDLCPEGGPDEDYWPDSE